MSFRELAENKEDINSSEYQYEKRKELIQYAIDNKLTVFAESRAVLLLEEEVEDKIKELKIKQCVNFVYFRNAINGALMVEIPFMGDMVKKDYESEAYKAYNK